MTPARPIFFSRAFALGIVFALTHAALFAELDDASGLRTIPDIEVQDQNGQTLHFYSDLVKGKIVAVNFLFTGCSTICPQLGASSAALAKQLAAKNDDRFRVISISFDPGADTPERLREWSAHFGSTPGWTLVTGKRRDIDTLLRALQVYTADKNLHSGNFLLGNEAAGEWRRIGGTVSPEKLVQTLDELAGFTQQPVGRGLPTPPWPNEAGSGDPALHQAATGRLVPFVREERIQSAKAEPGPASQTVPAPPPAAAAARYFPDVVLVNQDGESRRFYTDLVKGRIVVINTIFSDCGGVCPIMAERFAKVQAQLGERVGRDVYLLSISVDPVTDTPAKLHAYAERVGAKPGWQFLTGEKANVDLVLKKLGQYVESRDAHSNLFIIGNEPTGLWKKAFGLAPAEEIVQVVESVVNDQR